MKSTIPLALLALLLAVSCKQEVSTTDARIDERVDSVLSLMTLEEKIGQMVLYTSDWDVTGPTMRDSYLTTYATDIAETFSMPTRQPIHASCKR